SPTKQPEDGRKSAPPVHRKAERTIEPFSLDSTSLSLPSTPIKQNSLNGFKNAPIRSPGRNHMAPNSPMLNPSPHVTPPRTQQRSLPSSPRNVQSWNSLPQFNIQQ